MSTLEFRGIHADILADRSPERLIEGSLSSGKTTVAMWAELEALKQFPGIWILLTRWTDDAVKTLLRPAWEQLARIHNTAMTWTAQENYYALENGSRAFAFGLKTLSSDPLQKYAKIRGLPVSRILFDQAEQGHGDVFSELRFRLRPDIEARLRGVRYPTQLTLVANPVPDDHPLAREFPTSNKIKGRRHFSLSLFANAHNLPESMIESLLTLYPPEHPRYATMILGERGLTVVGDPIYENLFDRATHVRLIAVDDDFPILEAFEFGQHNPVWIAAQRSFHGGMNYLGGVIGKRMMLEDFLPLVDRYRSTWFPNLHDFRTCTTPMGTAGGYTLISKLQEAGYRPVWREDGNAADVQLAMIEHIAGDLRRRTIAREEAIGINADKSHWISVSQDGVAKEVPFLSFGFEGGYTWSDHMVSVGNKTVRQPKDDGEYSNAMRCLEHIALNFCAGVPTDAEKREREKRQRQDSAFAGPSASMGEHGWLVS